MTDIQPATQRSLFCFYDKKAENFLGNIVQAERHPAPIIRQFHALLQDKSTVLGQHPADFIALHLGYIDDDGAITPIAPLTIATGEAWLAAQEAIRGS